MFYNDPSQPGNQSSWNEYGNAPDQTVQQPTPGPAVRPPVPVTQETQAIPSSPWPASYPPATPSPQQRPARSRMQSGAIFALTAVVLLIFVAGLFSGWKFASSRGVSTSPTSPSVASSTSTGTNTTLAETVQEAVIAKVEPTVVEIEGTTGQGEAIGSGIIVDSKGDIVTNDHVVNGTTSLEVILSNGETETAQIVGTDQAVDLAVIRIQPFANMAVATLGDSSKLSVGEEVLAIGNPLGYTGTATQGVVSALNRTVSESDTVTLRGLIQTSAAINPGNSGGALVNMQGQVVGMPTLSALDTETNQPANGLGFAISSNQIKTVVAQLLNS